MNKYLLLGMVAFLLFCFNIRLLGQDKYIAYHIGILKCEELVAANKFEEAINGLDILFKQFDFVFLRDYKVATELSAHVKDLNSGFKFIRLGILSGWTLKDIKKNSKLDLFKDDPRWKEVKSNYDSLHNQYLEQLNNALRNQVHQMYKNDQKKAIGALLRLSEKSKVNYAENNFAPNSEKQLDQLNQILDHEGYPGEQLIGNDWWASTIFSHHNSISVDYNSKDTLYLQTKLKLVSALKNGKISLHEFCIIQDWRTAVLNGHQLTSYGFLGTISDTSMLEVVNKNRSDIGLRSIELRNKLIDMENEAGINLYLPKGWQKGKIKVAKKD